MRVLEELREGGIRPGTPRYHEVTWGGKSAGHFPPRFQNTQQYKMRMHGMKINTSNYMTEITVPDTGGYQRTRKRESNDLTDGKIKSLAFEN